MSFQRYSAKLGQSQKSDNPVYLKQYERLLQAMHKAGVPEQ
jgi:hypothetical protein